MQHALAILPPPLAIPVTGRAILSVVVVLIRVPALVCSGERAHPMFILPAWFLIFHARQGRRPRGDLS